MMAQPHLQEALALAERLANVSITAVRKTGVTKAPNSLCVPENVRRRHVSAPDSDHPDFGENPPNIPPKQLLLYVVRMGSFTSAPKIANDDLQDNEIEFPTRLSRDELLERCRREQRHSAVKRAFRRIPNTHSTAADDRGDEDREETSVRVLRWNVMSKSCGEAVSSPDHLRVLQWNVLAQALGQLTDNFACCPEEALEWSSRRYQMLEEIIEYCPDIICLQEVDHFRFLSSALASQGYTGIFVPKPDSPCIYIKGNNGPDGCAIFYRTNKFEQLGAAHSRVLEVWGVQSNQVAVLVNLRMRDTGREVSVATTHLKARKGALLSTLRDEQGKDLLRFLNTHTQGRPLVLGGDFNAEPSEPVYMTVSAHQALGLSSAYASANDGLEPPYTTWKVREGEGEICHTIDYVFYSQRHLAVDAVLEFPSGEEIGEGRIPSLCYPSDHFSLVCDLRFTQPIASSL